MRLPLRSAYAELGGSVTRLRGPEAWLEAGVHPLRNVALYGRAWADSRDVGAAVGARLEVDW